MAAPAPPGALPQCLDQDDSSSSSDGAGGGDGDEGDGELPALNATESLEVLRHESMVAAVRAVAAARGRSPDDTRLVEAALSDHWLESLADWVSLSPSEQARVRATLLLVGLALVVLLTRRVRGAHVWQVGLPVVLEHDLEQLARLLLRRHRQRQHQSETHLESLALPQADASSLLEEEQQQQQQQQQASDALPSGAAAAAATNGASTNDNNAASSSSATSTAVGRSYPGLLPTAVCYNLFCPIMSDSHVLIGTRAIACPLQMSTAAFLDEVRRRASHHAAAAAAGAARARRLSELRNCSWVAVRRYSICKARASRAPTRYPCATRYGPTGCCTTAARRTSFSRRCSSVVHLPLRRTVVRPKRVTLTGARNRHRGLAELSGPARARVHVPRVRDR